MKIKKIAATAAAAAVLASAPITGALPDVMTVTASAAENITSGDLKFKTLNDGTLSVSGLADPGKKSTITEIVIPGEVNGKSVTAIEAHAFIQCKNLKSVTIPDSVTSISTWSFSDCTKLKYKQKQYCANDLYYVIKKYTYNKDGLCIVDNVVVDCMNDAEQVVIPNGVTSIGESAFSGCASLASVTIPDGVTSIGRSAFSGCESLTSVTIPDGVTTVEDYAFSGCESLTSVTIPDGVTSIYVGAFDRCKSLADITIPESVTSISFATFDENLKNVYYKGSEEQWKKIDCYSPGPGESHCTLGSEADDMMKLFGAETVQEYLFGKAAVHFNSADPAGTTSGDPGSPSDPVSEPTSDPVSEPTSDPVSEPDNTSDGDAGNPSTGFGGVMAVFGVAAVAGTFVIVSRKRK